MITSHDMETVCYDSISNDTVYSGTHYLIIIDVDGNMREVE